MILLTLDGTGPLYRQVYRALRSEILSGRLGPGSALPASRTLAEGLAISRNTVIAAYRQFAGRRLLGIPYWLRELCRQPPTGFAVGREPRRRAGGSRAGERDFVAVVETRASFAG